MKRFYSLLFLLLFSSICYSQNTTSITGTVTDSDGQAWVNATWVATIVIPGGGGTAHYLSGGAVPTSFSGVLTSSGAFSSAAVGNVAKIVPTGVTWKYCFYSVTSAPASCFSQATNGSTFNLGATASSLVTAPRIPASKDNYAYSATEIINPSNGTGYVNTASGQIFAWQQCTANDSTCYLLVGSGSTLPTAIYAGQILTSTAAGTTYAVQPKIFYSQPGDTLVSITSACAGSPCMYTITSPQTITLVGNTNLASNIALNFTPGGLWTVNGAYSLTLYQITGSINQHFAGTSSIIGLMGVVPVEWFGAIGDWNGTTGTDNTTPINLTLSAITAGCSKLQASSYKIASTLHITKSYDGICGTTLGSLVSSEITLGNHASYLYETSASADAIDVAGTDVNNLVTSTQLRNFSVVRTVAGTGTAAGIYLNFTEEAQIDSVFSYDSVYPFHFHGSGSGATGYIQHSLAIWGAGTAPCPTIPNAGFFIDSVDNIQNPSLLFLNDEAASSCVANPIFGLYDYGQNIRDLIVTNFQTTTILWGVWIECTTCAVAPGDIVSSDIFLTNLILDQGYATGALLTLKKTNGVTVQGGLFNSRDTDAVACSGIDVESSSGFNISGAQVFAPAICINNSTTGSLSHNLELRTNGTTNLALNGSSQIMESGNTWVIAAAGDPCCHAVEVVGGSKNIIGPDAYSSPGTNLYTVDATSTLNTVTANMMVSDASTNDSVIFNVPPMLVSALPAASSLPPGTQLKVSDATALGVTCVGGGSTYATCVTNGSTWTAH